MTPKIKRLMFPLRAPRWQTHAFWPLHLLAAAVDSYHAAFFMSLTPPAAGTASHDDSIIRRGG